MFVTDADDREVLAYDGSTGQIVERFVHGNGIDETLNRSDGTGARATLIPDIQGSVIATLDSSTGALTKFGYRAFGQSPSTVGRK